MWNICDTKVYLGFNVSLFPIIEFGKKLKIQKMKKKKLIKMKRTLFTRKKTCQATIGAKSSLVGFFLKLKLN
jgi:hypothetical protein